MIVPEIDEPIELSYDKMINSKVQFQHDNLMETGKVKIRAIGSFGNVTVLYDDNPIMNSTIYEVEFPDGQVKEYATNVIAEKISTKWMKMDLVLLYSAI